MDPEQLREEIDSGDMRMSRIQYLRDELQDLLGMRIPRNPSDIETWWQKNKSVVGREVNKMLDDQDEEIEEEVKEEVETEEVKEQD